MTITITLRPLKNTPFTVEIDNCEITISDLKDIIHKATNNEYESFKLIHKGSILANDKTLSSYNIKTNCEIIFLPDKPKIVAVVPKAEIKETPEIVVVNDNANLQSPRASPLSTPDLSEEENGNGGEDAWLNNPDNARPQLNNINLNQVLNDPAAFMEMLGVQPGENGEIPEEVNNFMNQLGQINNQIGQLNNLYQQYAGGNDDLGDLDDQIYGNVMAGGMGNAGNIVMDGNMDFNVRALIDALPQKYPHANLNPDDLDIIENIADIYHGRLENIVEYYVAFDKNQDATLGALLG